MAETTTKKEPTVDVVTTAGADATLQEPLQQSLDELARVADALVDNLTADSPELEQPREDPSQQSRREALQETLDKLDHLIEDPSPPPVSAEVQLDGDRGEDISDRLDALLTTEPHAGGASRAADPAGDPGRSTDTIAKATVAVTPELVSRLATSAPATRRRRPTTAFWWTLAVIAVLGAAAGVYWYLPAPAETPVEFAETIMPDPPVVFTKPPHRNPDVAAVAYGAASAENTPQTPEPAQTEPVIEPAAPQADEVTISYAAPKPEDIPQTPEPAQIEPVIEPAAPQADEATTSYAAPKPEDIPQTPEPAQTEPVIEPAAPQADEATVSYAATAPGPSAEGSGATLLPAPVELPPPPAPEPLPETPRFTESEPAPVEAVPVEPATAVAVPADQPPVVIDRIEPVFDSKSIRRGETQTVVLRVLVNESGRVARVVVDESVKGSETEVAAINAVLRWSYQPALENGQPVRRWTTERFEFRRRSD